MNANHAALLIGLLALLTMPGCIVQDIRDNLAKANTSLPEVEVTIAKTSSELSTTNAHLAGLDTNLATTVRDLSQTNEQMKSIEAGLTKTNQSLAVVEQNLIHVNEHLASLRTTIAKIDSTVPFLDLGGNAPTEETPSPAATVTGEQTKDLSQGAAASPDAAPLDVPTTAATSTTPRDSLVGPWISADPSRQLTLLLLPNGRYVSETVEQFSLSGGQTSSRIRHEEGTWKREGADQKLVIVLTSNAVDDAVHTEVQRASLTTQYRVLHQTSRTLSLQSSDRLFVLRRP